MGMKYIHRVCIFLCLSVPAFILPGGAWAQSSGPRYVVDASWPKPLPNRWITGGIGGVCVDARDHVFLLNRPEEVKPAELNSGHAAPIIIEMDPDGAVVNSWGDPNLLDPHIHSCYVDKDTNIWIASSPSGMVQKYSHDGSKLLLQLGKKGVYDSSDGTAKGTPLNSPAPVFYMPSSLYVDPKNGDLYVADGEAPRGNRRIIVLDREGKFLRQWQPEGTTTAHCMTAANDGLLYVCDRQGGRILVYDKMGKLTKTIEVPWTPYTPPADGKPATGLGAAVTLDFSHDPTQRFMFNVNQNNSQIDIIERESGKILSNFGGLGTFPGQFTQPHGIAVDSKDNVYVAETIGRRVQKFKLVK